MQCAAGSPAGLPRPGQPPARPPCTHCMHRRSRHGRRPPTAPCFPPLCHCANSSGPLSHHPSYRRVFWLAASAGYSVDFAAIVMHAVASDDESFGKPCLYCQLDSEEEGEGGLGGSGSGSEEEEEEEGEGGQAGVLPELRLIPADASQREWAVPCVQAQALLGWLGRAAMLQTQLGGRTVGSPMAGPALHAVLSMTMGPLLPAPAPHPAHWSPSPHLANQPPSPAPPFRPCLQLTICSRPSAREQSATLTGAVSTEHPSALAVAARTARTSGRCCRAFGGGPPACTRLLHPACLPRRPTDRALPAVLFCAAEEEEEGEGGGVFYDEDEVLAGAAAASLGVGDVEEVRA